MGARSVLDYLDVTRMVDASRVRLGALRMRGVPAVLAGVATIVLAVGATRAVTAVAFGIPDAARASRIAMRERPELRP